MNTKEYAEELILKEERISDWESYGISSGLLDREYTVMPKIEYWYLG